MFNPFKKGKKPEDLKGVLKSLEDLEKRVNKNSEELERIKKENKLHLQKIGIIRYNPFSGVGSDQSFSIALLDDNEDGVAITSLYSREGNHIYAKPIRAGKSEYLLSDEEKEAIKRAVGTDKL